MKPRDLLFVEAINSLGDKLRGGVNETGVEDQLARLEAKLEAERQETERKALVQKAEEDIQWDRLQTMLARIAETKEGEKKASDTSN